jgi:hypothetical protein
MLDPQVKNSSSSFLIKLLEKMIYKKFTRDSLFSVDDSSNFLSDSENSYL